MLPSATTTTLAVRSCRSSSRRHVCRPASTVVKPLSQATISPSLRVSATASTTSTKRCIASPCRHRSAASCSTAAWHHQGEASAPAPGHLFRQHHVYPRGAAPFRHRHHARHHIAYRQRRRAQLRILREDLPGLLHHSRRQRGLPAQRPSHDEERIPLCRCPCGPEDITHHRFLTHQA